ncbi:two-component sensor histidine kinase [Actinomyces naeslundii]|uniref:Two-component sensor histidine kinase n=1 Tax=Actinomyces naeslundii TaxID=1655 RepID=A0ABX3EZM3_ACTNA|nr:histidine kinase [Actinomyces naeslundii]OLO81747.1 two-component sensor histidine kinase [Actinomyces naeslundii]OLO84868.1 two-component sensor histidine kinase [Actinomyces naeslundii]OLO87743.1 two-component sensor histidine kinase [Actinomyces naeslundii]OMG14735.1 two-component sensor histidine kinase [Actinomyces naeslundii]OMG23981.1 two-component sensor histidine kinase [Actinomyces naeslundii]
MKVLIDNGVLLGGCVLLALLVGRAETAVVIWLIAAVAVAGLGVTVKQGRWTVAVPVAYLLVGSFSTASVVGAPLAVYGLARLGALGTRHARMVAAIGCIPFVALMARRVPGAPVMALALAICALAALLALRTLQEETVRMSLHAVRDDLREKVLTLQDTNARLLQAQDHELRAAALSERTRIAREIHDGVGHLLTRLLLQVKALQVVHRDAPGVVDDLATLDDGLDEALDSMRRSVHALSDEGEEMATSLNLLGSRCGITAVSVDCSTDVEPPAAVARCVVAVVREALTNAARHGSAYSARVTVTDYPAFWQVTVDNDGVVPVEDEPAVDGRGSAGLGLRSMTERVEALGGRVRITPRPRFTVFATIPKDGQGKEGAS